MPDAPALPTIAVISHMYPRNGNDAYGIFVAEQVRALVGIGAPPSAVVSPVPIAPWPLPALNPRWREYAQAERARTDFGAVPVTFPRYLSFPRKALRDVSAGSAARAILSDAGLMDGLRRADALVAHTALLDGNVARRLSPVLGAPYIVFVHGEDLAQNARADAPVGVREGVRAALADAATVVAVSSVVAAGLREAFPALENVRVLHNGVDPKRFTPADVSTEQHGPEGPLRIVSASRLVETKAHAFVLEAIAMLAARGMETEYTIAGDGPERTRLEGLARYLGIAEHVRFTGAFSHEDMPAILRAADLFVLPGWEEAFGIVYLEAMACGLPVVAASDGGAREIVDDGIDGFLVPPRDAEAIAGAIKGFAGRDAVARAEMGAAARGKAERFTWESNARGLLDIVAAVSRPHPV